MSGISLIWSAHAIERARERFADLGGYIGIVEPKDRILKVAAILPINTTFYIRTKPIVYVCVRRTVNECIIKTVMKRDEQTGR